MPKKGPNIYKRNDGRWEGRISVIDENGNKKYKSIYARTKKELKEKLKLEKQKLQEKEESIKFKVAVERWLNEKRKNVKIASYNTYKSKAERLIDYFKEYKVAEISENVIKEYSKSLIQNGLSERIINETLRTLKSIISFNGNEEHNKNEISSQSNSSGRNMTMLTTEESKLLIEYCCSDITPYKTIILLVLYTGLRLSEVVALRWEDIDLQHGTICVNKVMQRVKDYDDNSTKIITNEIDERIVYLPSNAVKILKKIRHKKQNYISTNKENPIDFRTIQKALSDLNLDIPKLSFLDLRDNFALYSIESGIDVRIISQNMGVNFEALKKYFDFLTQLPNPQKEIKKFIF